MKDMISLADRESVRAVDAAAMKDFSISGLQLMELAGAGLARSVKGELLRRGRDLPGARVAVVAGKGNNGGDGFVAARHLANAGARVAVYLLCPVTALRGDAAANARIWHRMKGELRAIGSASALARHESALRHSAVIVDCIFGTGLASPVSGLHARAIELINAAGKPVVSADLPSGIDATTGGVLGAAVRASVTSTMAMPKIGIYLYPGRDCAGRIEVVDIGVPRSLIDGGRGPSAYLVTGRGVGSIVGPRAADSHKGTFGHLVAAGGSQGKTGAIVMAASAAMRAGAGLVTIACPSDVSAAVEAKTTEVMTAALPGSVDGTLGPESLEVLLRLIEGKSALVIGPGLGANSATASLVGKLAANVKTPMVIDADALNSLGGPGLLRKAAGEVVLTPHPAEMARLLKTTTAEVQADRPGTARRLAKESRATVVLKGAATVTATPGGDVYINPTGNPALATAGTGDVLAGMIGGLMAQGYTGVESAVSAVYIHGLAADNFARERGCAGMVATDLLPIIPRLLGHYAALSD